VALVDGGVETVEAIQVPVKGLEVALQELLSQSTEAVDRLPPKGLRVAQSMAINFKFHYLVAQEEEGRICLAAAVAVVRC